MRQLRGLKALVHDAVDVTTDLVEEMNDKVADKAIVALGLIQPLEKPARLVDRVRRLSAKGVYGRIHGVNRVVSRLGDIGLEAANRDPAAGPSIVPMRSDCTSTAAWREDAAIGALNGVIGDQLHARGNDLDLGMGLRLGDRYVASEAIDAERVALFVHGVSVTEWNWCLNAEAFYGDPAEHFGTKLQRDCGYTPVFLRYNSGRHISENGRRLAELLEGTRCRELVIVGHSMGGLVARSAIHYAERDDRAWRQALTHLFCLGSPHHGAPLEKVGNALTSVLELFDLPGTLVPARVLNARSAGIKDLRFGYLLDEDWQGRDPDGPLEDNRHDVPLPDGVTCAFVATSLTERPDHPAGRLLGDIMVRTDSAGGPKTTERTFDIHSDHVGSVLHHEIGSHPDVYARVLATLLHATRSPAS